METKEDKEEIGQRRVQRNPSQLLSPQNFSETEGSRLLKDEMDKSQDISKFFKGETSDLKRLDSSGFGTITRIATNKKSESTYLF